LFVGRQSLVRLAEMLRPRSVFVEFRHASWERDDVPRWLAASDLGYCTVDEPALAGLVRPHEHVTAADGYVRLHGRNRQNWWGRGDGDRYDYRYREDELREWVTRIRSLARKSRRVWVFFNNCHAGQAVEGAFTMARLLHLDLPGPVQGELL